MPPLALPLLALLTVAPGAARAQDTSLADLPHFRIDTRADLIAAFGPMHAIGGIYPRSAIIALDGRRLLPWLLEIATDDGTPSLARFGALEVLGFTRDTEAVEALLRLAHSNAPAIRGVAAEALRGFTDARVCDLWRDALGSAAAAMSMRYDAVAGLGFCGGPADTALILRFKRAHPKSSPGKMTADAALIRIRLGDARFTWHSRWAGPPRADGAFVPSPHVAADIRSAACPSGCTGQFLDPHAPLPGERRH